MLDTTAVVVSVLAWQAYKWWKAKGASDTPAKKQPWPQEGVPPQPLKKQAEERWKTMTPKEKQQATKATTQDWGTDEEALKEAARRKK